MHLPSSVGVSLCTRQVEVEKEACITLYTPVVRYLEPAVSEEVRVLPMMGPLLVRLAWHSAGTYNGDLYPLGGTAGGCIRMPPESLDGANAKTNPAVVLVYSYVAKFAFVSFADMVQLVAAVVHEVLSGELLQLEFSPGRPDFHIKTADRRCSPNGRLPAKELTEDTDYDNLNITRQYIIDIYARYLHALDTEQNAGGRYTERFILEAVSLMGGHTVGGMHLDISGNEGNFTKHPYIFDNEFFVHLLEYGWDSRVRIGGGEADAMGVQYVQAGVTMLPTDVAIIKHPQLRAATVAFAENNTLFLDVYAIAWTRLVENGVIFADATNPSATEPPEGPETCTHSTLAGYECVQSIFDGMALHWRLIKTQNGTRLDLALVCQNVGRWFALAFPQNSGVMAPASAVVLDESGTRFVQIAAKQESAIVDVPANGFVQDTSHGLENGAAVLSFSIVRSEAVLSSLPVNVAMGAGMKFAKHRNTAALVVNFVTGTIEDVAIESSLTFWRRLHGALMCFSCIFCFPLAIFTKRYSKRLFAVSDASRGSKMGPAMKAHIILHLTGFTSVIVSIAIAFVKLGDSGNPDPLRHREVGIFIFSLLGTLILLGMLSTVNLPTTAADILLKGKPIIRRIHRTLGATLFVFLALQLYSGAGRVSDTDAGAQPFVVLISGGAAFVATMFVIGELCVALGTRRSSTEREDRGPSMTKDRKTYTPQELAMHTDLNDTWIALDGKVYNVTEWYEHHPGGADVLLGYAGRDASDAFYEVQHSAAGLRILRQFYVGDLEGEDTSDLVDAIDEITQNTAQLDLDSARLQLTKEGTLPRSVVLSFKQLIDAVDSFLPYLPESLKLVYRAESNDPNKLINAVHEQHNNTIAYLMESSPPEVCTIVFTDIQESTRLWEDCEMGMQTALEVHNRTIRTAINDCKGYEVKTIGDAFMVAFIETPDAVRFATRVQCDLLTAEWPCTLLAHPMCEPKYDPLTCELMWSGIRVRIGMHCGPVNPQINPLTGRLDFFGNTVNKAARVESQALGGGTCVTPEVWDVVAKKECDMSMNSTRVSLPDFEAYSLKAMTTIRRKDVKLKGIPNTTDLLIVFPEGLEGRALSDTTKKKVVIDSPMNLDVSRNPSVAPPLAGNEITKAVATVCSPVFLPRRYAAEMDAASHTNTLISKMMLHASRGGGVMHSISGCLALVGFNIAMPCINHPAAAAKFACTLCTETVDENNERGDIILVEPGVAMGIVTGNVLQGRMGRRTQKTLAILGPAVEFSMRLAFHSEELDTAVLCGVIPGIGGIPSDPLITRHCRVADVWETDLPEHLVVVHELNIKHLRQNTTTCGFLNEAPPGTSWGISEMQILPLFAVKQESDNLSSGYDATYQAYANAAGPASCMKCNEEAVMTCTVCKIALCATCPSEHEGCELPRYAGVFHETVGVTENMLRVLSSLVDGSSLDNKIRLRLPNEKGFNTITEKCDKASRASDKVSDKRSNCASPRNFPGESAGAGDAAELSLHIPAI